MQLHTRFLSALAAILVTLMLVTTGAVLFGYGPPVFNQHLHAVRLLGEACFAVLLAAAVVLGLHAATGRLPRVAQWMRVGLAAALLLEAGFRGVDALLMSSRHSLMTDAFRNESLPDGEVVVLHRPDSLSVFGFRTPRVEPPTTAGYRVLFLGDSYVYGSGSTFAVNYPQVVERDLRASAPARNVTVMSAGVSGAGVHDELLVYRYLLEHGYRFDAVVLNVFMQNDPTDDVPGTYRTAIGGQPARLPNNPLLRYFYPLNSYTFRYAIYIGILATAPWIPRAEPGNHTASCDPSPGFAHYVRDQAHYHYAPGSRAHVYVNALAASARQIAGLAREHDNRFLMVVLPDPAAALDRLRNLAGGDSLDWNWTRLELEQQLTGVAPVLDITPALRNRDDLFKCDDVHWDDAGNVVAAHAVSAWLDRELWPPTAHGQRQPTDSPPLHSAATTRRPTAGSTSRSRRLVPASANGNRRPMAHH